MAAIRSTSAATARTSARVWRQIERSRSWLTWARWHPALPPSLTAREVEILRLIVAGLTNGESPNGTSSARWRPT